MYINIYYVHGVGFVVNAVAVESMQVCRRRSWAVAALSFVIMTHNNPLCVVVPVLRGLTFGTQNSQSTNIMNCNVIIHDNFPYRCH